MSGVRRRGFGLFWAGRAASQFGDEITVLALPWLVAQETGSPFAVGSLEALVYVPALLFALPLGAWADRRSRKRSMIEADLIRMVLLGSIPIAVLAGFGPSLGLVMVVGFLAGMARILFEASAQAFLPDLVPQKGIVRANSRLSLTEGLATILAPVTAGLLIATVGASDAIGLDALTFAFSAGTLWLVWVERERFGVVREGMGSAMRAGVRATARNPFVRALTLTVGASNVGSGFVIGMMAIFLQQTLGLHGWQAGIVYASNGVGGVLAAAITPRLAPRMGIARPILVGLAVTTVGISLVSISTSATWYILTTVGDGLVGFGIVLIIISSASLRQRTVPSELLGRVTVSYRLVASGSIALGAFIGGIVGETVGVRQAIVVGAVIYAVVATMALRTCLNGPEPQGVVVTT